MHTPHSMRIAQRIAAPFKSRGALALHLFAFAIASLRGASAQDWPSITAKSMHTGFAFPVHVAHAGDDSGRLFVVEIGGRIQVIQPDGTRSQFLDMAGRSGCSQGLLSVAFPPNFAAKRCFYVNYTDATNCDLVISRIFVTAANPNLADVSTEQVILRVPLPTSYTAPAIFHSGGELAFGPDGCLYVGIGDGDTGSSPGDSLQVAQSLSSLRGKILRLDVESGTPYAIPATNPFVNTPGARGEIWAVGVRNPWRSSFDRVTGDYYFGDVGQDTYEEINFQAANSAGGINFGWRLMEGSQCYDPEIGCDPSGELTLPIAEYAVVRFGGDNCIVGGRVYRGGSSRLQGIFFYGDYGSGRVAGLRYRNGTWETATLIAPGVFPRDRLLSFGEDEAGNLYVVLQTGEIFQLTTTENTAPVATDASIATSEDQTVNISLSGSDADGDTLEFVVVTPPTHGTLSGAAANVTYTPANNYAGSDSFSFKVNDGTADSNTATVAVSVSPVNDAPVAVKDSASTKKNTAVTIAALANDSDVDGDALTITSISAPSRGSATIINQGTAIRYTPARNASGNVSFNYTVSDGHGGQAIAAITVAVTPK